MRPTRPLRRPARATTRQVSFPAPIGGVNSVDVAGQLPPTDSVYCYNAVPADNGLRVRLGYREWCTGLTGAADNNVRSVLPFSGSHKNGSTDKLFAVTSSGIWDVSTSTTTPSKLVTFGTTTGDAGYGVSTVFSTPSGGRFLVYCDEVNGAYVWSESGGTWTQVSATATQLWAPSTAYLVNDQVVNGGNVYQCTAAGTSASSGGPTGTGTAIADGSVTWKYLAAAVSTAIGPSLADQHNGLSGSPANFAAVAVWKSRLWFVERDSSRAWYMPVGQVYGTATSFDFGPKMRAGGPLAGLFNWAYDGGAGLDTYLVGISSAGDVVIYQGTDPSSASTFGLKGAWYVGGVPYGRHVATDTGGDMLVLSLLGVLPLSKLIVGQPVVAGDRSIYATGKVTPLFQYLAQQYQGLQGWSVCVHPTDGVLLIAVPQAAGQATNQLAMSFATRGWGQYRNLPLLSMGVWDGNLYFGTQDGRVCLNTGYVDGVQLANANAYSPVAWSVLPGFRDGSSRNLKRVVMMRAVVRSQSPSPIVQCTAKYDFDAMEPAPPAATGPAAGGNTWDSAIWDSSTWGGDYQTALELQGGVGMGRSLSVAVQGLAVSRTTLVGVDVFYEEGGPL